MKYILLLLIPFVFIGCISLGGGSVTPNIPDETIADVKFGLHVHPESFNPNDLQRVKDCAYFAVVQIWRGSWIIDDVRAKIIDTVSLLHGAGLKVTVRIEDERAYYSKEWDWNRPTNDDWFNTVYAPLINQVMFNLRDKLWAVQVYNEPEIKDMWLTGPNGGPITPIEMVALFVKAKNVIRFFSSDIKVLMPATVNFHSERSKQFTIGLIDAGILNVTDLFNVHIYSENLYSQRHHYAELWQLLGEFPVFVSEFNGTSGQSTTRRWAAMKAIADVCQQYYNMVGMVAYNWEDPSGSGRFNVKDTVAEEALKKIKSEHIS